MASKSDKASKSRKIDASTVILGFTGSIGSGCSYVSRTIPIIDGKKYRYYKLSDILRELLKKEGFENPSVSQLQNKGNSLRQQNKPGYLVGKMLDKIEEEGWEDDDYGIIIDGIKNEGEVLSLRQFPFFYLFSVQAEQETRCKRKLKDKLFKDIDEFNEADRRDQLENYEFGQQVAKCDYLADVIILNETNIPDAATTEKENFVRDKYNKYIKLIENLKDEARPGNNTPSIEELCMTIAYALSKSSNCLKRKVGAVVVDINKMEVTEGDGIKRHLKMPYIVSSGYNEVPLGHYPCLYDHDYEKCYRDYLQENFARKLLYCPACGVKIDIHTECPYCGTKYDRYIKTCDSCKKEFYTRYKCKCEVSIYDEYLIGGKHSSGKLLDMCHSLHAEETALLKFGQSGGKYSENVVLFVTTQPCNLCANKIILSGIKKVVFAEPYSMKEAVEKLEMGGVKAVRFEGVKSSAYFKLYQ